MFDTIREALGAYQDGIPNKFTIALGKLIKEARLELKMSQAELAEAAYFSQTAISQVEQGKRNVTASEIIYLSSALNKPILYFYPPFYRNADESKLTPLEQELLIQAKRLTNDDLRKLIAQARALADLSDGK